MRADDPDAVARLRRRKTREAKPLAVMVPTLEIAAALGSLGYLGGRAPARESYNEADDPKNLIHLDNKMHQVVDFLVDLD